MEDKKKSAVENDKEIIHSKAIKAGKRIYYLDVKRNRKGEMFISVTESKKVVTGEGLESQVSFEKHKIFLYQEDFTKFTEALGEMMQYIENEQGPFVPYYNNEAPAEADETLSPSEEAEKADAPLTDGEIKIDIDF